jgi:hypothetical protein
MATRGAGGGGLVKTGLLLNAPAAVVMCFGLWAALEVREFILLKLGVAYAMVITLAVVAGYGLDQWASRTGFGPSRSSSLMRRFLWWELRSWLWVQPGLVPAAVGLAVLIEMGNINNIPRSAVGLLIECYALVSAAYLVLAGLVIAVELGLAAAARGTSAGTGTASPPPRLRPRRSHARRAHRG